MTSEQIKTLASLMLEYIPPTLKLFGFTLLYSIPLGMIVALLKMCKFKPISWLTNIYILIMRGTPLLLQLIVAQYSVPYLLKWEGCPSFIQKTSLHLLRKKVLFVARLRHLVYNMSREEGLEHTAGRMEADPDGARHARV